MPMMFRHLQGREVCGACTESALKRRTGCFKKLDLKLIPICLFMAAG